MTHPHTFIKDNIPNTVLALGYFDGVHLGHIQVIKTAKDIAVSKGYKSAVMTFDPHPSVVLNENRSTTEYITPLEDKKELIRELGIDYLYIVEFTPVFANLLPQEFVDDYIIGLNIKHVVAGFDFSYGKMGKGNMETLPFHSREVFTQTTVEKLTSHEDKISSTVIRRLIQGGEVSKLHSLLGRYYYVKGKVIHGDARGRTIGFPTANVSLTANYIPPATGVYAVKINVKSKWYIGVCNIGVKPTFNKNNDTPTIEVHILDFDDEIYGDHVIVEWHKRIRAEKKFNSITDLTDQIKRDTQSTIDYFGKISEQTCFLS
jgi:riboflavin kinase / FMN adenylyltransferase